MMPESPRWLLECGKYTDFKKVMRDLDRKAKTKIPKKIWKRMDKLIQSESAPPTCCQRIKYLFVRNPNISANHSSWDTIKMTWNNRMMRKWLWFFSVVRYEANNCFSSIFFLLVFFCKYPSSTPRLMVLFTRKGWKNCSRFSLFFFWQSSTFQLKTFERSFFYNIGNRLKI